MRTAERDRDWDVIVIGTGIGGGTFGHALARAGKRVLFCERGASLLGEGLRARFAETFRPRRGHDNEQERDLFARAGRYADPIRDESRKTPRRHVPFIGSGTGGSSAIYGMALERFFPADFTPRRYYPHAGDAALPDAWPVTYEEMAYYYQHAERLYRVRGSTDPCRREPGDRASFAPAPSMSRAGQELFEHFQSKGLHPYRLPAACEFVDGCLGCQGFLCPRECKNDSARICLRPALEQYGATLLSNCEVVRIEAGRRKVTGVRVLDNGQPRLLRAKLVVLAAGALETPRLLLASRSAAWPFGLANESGLVGKHLMRHFVDLYAVRTDQNEVRASHKEIALNDFYLSGIGKLGTLQSFGALPPAEVLVADLQKQVADGPLGFLSVPFPVAAPMLKAVLARLFERRLILASILEDLPYEDNRVTLPDAPASARVVVHYRVRPSERARIATFRKVVSRMLAPYRPLVIKQAENNERIAHACGTCRFGEDPTTSVLDPMNRAHGLDNLYVVDSSFFPSSGGTNPGLTIAANALRVAHRLEGERAVANG
jgi:choline dehydrogenase-like flavoprotein